MILYFYDDQPLRRLELRTFRIRGGPRKQRLDNKRNFSTRSTAFTEQISLSVVNASVKPSCLKP